MTDLPTCSAIVVTYNGRDYLDRCIGALLDLDYPAIEILAIDNGSSDGTVAYLREQFPSVTVYENTSNNFASAVQWGIDHSSGALVALVNNDTQLDRQWLRVLADYLRAKREVGGVAGKICFPDGRIDSVGHVRLPEHYWSDLGMGERDRGQYDQAEAVEGLCWAAALFRRECLEDVGEIDRQFVMYFEDVDYAERCRQAGWELHYVPEAIALHEGGASSQGSSLTDYFCNRNRFLFLAKHEPEELLGAIETSGFLIRQRWDWLLEALTMAWHKLMLHHDAATVDRILPPLVDRVTELCGSPGVDLALAKLSAIHGDRPFTIAIYDHALHTIGGGQRYLATLAAVLQDQKSQGQERFAITFIANKPVEIAQLEAWYGLRLDRCQIEILPLPFFDRQNAEIDGTWVTAETPENPFTPVSDRSADFDIFINANQLTRVEPRSPVSLFFCHFPDSWRDTHFAADRYTLLIANSHYTERWIRKLWNLEPSLRLYPPVVTAAEQTPDTTTKREPVILSVARFDVGGNKKQWEMIQAFRQLRDRDPERLQNWRLVLIGGSAGENAYLEKLRTEAQLDRSIELHVNLPLEEVNQWYQRASLFWHLCGLGEFLPERVEHFGMATVEAMQQGCIPIVFDGGGQREIVVDGVSGYRISTIETLLDRSLKLIRNPLQRHAMTQRVRDRGQSFNLEPFTDRVNALFDEIARELTTIALPDPGQIYQECKTLSVDEIQAALADPSTQ